MATVLVTGVGGPAGSNTARLLLERGHTIIGADMRIVTLPGIKFRRVPAAGEPNFLDEIDRIVVEEKVDLFIPTVSEELPRVAAARERWGNIPVVIAPYEAVHLANDKYLTCQRLASRGIAVPRYTLPSHVKSADEIAQTVGWPCVSKPRVGRGGREVTVHTAANWERIARLDDRYILQEFAPGTDYAPNLYLGRDSNATVVVLEKTRLKEGMVGNALEVQRVDAPDVAALAIAAGKALGFHGPLDVDVRRRADDLPVVLEINARFGANIAFAPEILDACLAANGIH